MVKGRSWLIQLLSYSSIKLRVVETKYRVSGNFIGDNLDLEDEDAVEPSHPQTAKNSDFSACETNPLNEGALGKEEDDNHW